MSLPLKTLNKQAETTDDGEVLVRVDSVSKKFCGSLKKSLWYGVQDIAREMNPFSRTCFNKEQGCTNVPLRSGEFWAVNNVSFELRRGECLGLIGHNGAGKTTLLKMLNGLIKPDQGRIEMRGRVCALIALGAGFNPILTGRENIYVNAAILGLDKNQIDEEIDEIISFAEIDDFIDTPVQNYSSGMQIRLGFAVATVLKPDVLLLDEILAVGDRSFRDKCYHRIGEMLSSAAVIFVSHDESSMRRISENAILLDRGRMVAQGSTSDVLERYNSEKGYVKSKTKFIQKNANISEVDAELIQISSSSRNGVNVSSLTIDLLIRVSSPILSGRLLALGNVSQDGSVVAVQFDFTRKLSEVHAGLNRIRFSVCNLSVSKGIYTVSLVVFDDEGKSILFSVRDFGTLTERLNVAYGPLVVAPVVDCE